MENLLQEKPLIITNYVWEQEKGNVDFLLENNIGFYQPYLNRLPKIVQSLLEDEDLRRQIKENIRKLNLKNGTPDVAKFIVEFN